MRAVVASIASVAVWLADLPARADANETAALAHLDRGVAAFRAKDFARAHREFAAASELAPDRANPYRWLALTEVQIGDCPRAVVHAEAFLSRVPPDDPRAAELVRIRDLCRRTGALRVRSSPSPVSLRIDGEPVGRTPYRSLAMRPGSYRVAAERDGYHPSERMVEVRAGTQVAVRLDLARIPPRPITRRWWFWAAVAGVAAAAATTAILLGADGEEVAVLPPIRCDEAGCDGR
jgi:PEGA domain